MNPTRDLCNRAHAAQNLCLAAAEQGLASLCMGGFRDSRLNALIGLSQPGEGVVYTLAFGRSAASDEARPGSSAG
ncbi:nitroreductase family protein [Paracoccus denitrificans]|uniref:nitroreductase family protein n=1 Tax=Paracoccus denitrificans TaxID=266 RepID=UPI001E4B1548|nr:nitroreductase family protein [Paracoccus denitrificans]UFS66672.1 nitroreductase family protein [Paracoccus denitrificans]